MKKFLFIVGLIILSAGIAAPFFRGLMMERIVKQSIDNLNQVYADTGSDVTVGIQKYDRGFSSSLIEWKMDLGVLETVYGIKEITFIDRADHGLTRIVSTTSLEKNKWYTDFVTDKLDGNNPLNIQTEYTFSGDIKSRVELNAFSFKSEKESIEMQPGTLLITLNNTLTDYFAEMDWKGFKVPGKFKMENLSVQSKLKKITPMIWDGYFSLTVNQVTTDDGSKPVDLSNITCDYALDYDEKDQSLSLQMAYGVDHVKSGRESIDNALIRIGVNRMDAGGYEDLVRMYSQVINNVLKEVGRSQEDPDKVKEVLGKQMGAAGLQMIGVYEKLLKTGFEIHISDLHAGIPQGEITADVLLRLKKDMTIAGFIPIMLKPSAALDYFSLKSDIRLPYELFGNKQNLLTPIYPGMQTGLFLKDRDVLIHSAETRDGKLFLNDTEVLLN